jgi:uncharacterized phage protein (TIGR01671 family)
MREIKFRAWRGGDGGCMEFGHYVADHGNINWFDLSNSVGKDLILMQYTGLKDKNGKEIYEGDILDEKSNSPFKVVWRDGDCGFCADSGDTLDYNLHALARFFEVVGNICENKDLAGDKED